MQITGDEFKLIILCVGAGSYAIWHSLKKIKIKRLIEDTPTSKARSAAQGFAEFQGYAWPLEMTVKCSQSNDCVYYSLVLQKKVKKKKNTEWVTVFSRSHAADFLIIESTGAIQVVLPKAQLEIQNRTTNWSSLSDLSRNHLIKNTFQDFNSSGFPPPTGLLGFLFGGCFRVVESFITLGCPILALGEFESLSAKEVKAPLTAGLQSFFNKVQNDPRLKIGTSSSFFDFNRDGKVSAVELRKALHYLARTLINADSKSIAKTGASTVPLHGQIKSSENHKLVIIDTHEKTLHEKSNWNFYLLFLFGVALISGGIALLYKVLS